MTYCSLILSLENSKNEFYKNMHFVLSSYEKANEWTLFIRTLFYTYDILSLCIFLLKSLSKPIVQKNSETLNLLQNSIKILPKNTEIPALLYEQTAYCSLKITPPILRKFSENIVLAGEFYLEQHLSKNSIYCLGISYYLFEKSCWFNILMRICELLIISLERINDNLNILRFYRKILEIMIKYAINDNQAEIYQKYIKSAEKVNSEKEKLSDSQKELVERLLEEQNFIKIKVESFELFTNQDKFYTNSKENMFYEEEEQNSEKKKNKGVYNKSQDWLTLAKMIDGDLSEIVENTANPKLKQREEMYRDLFFCNENKKSLSLYTKRRRTVYCMEPMKLRFYLQNNINSEIIISSLKCVCHYKNIDLLAKTQENTEDLENYTSEVLRNIMLKPYENKEIILTIIPKQNGFLYFDGIEWEISNIIKGNYSFNNHRKITAGKKEQLFVNVRNAVGYLTASPSNIQQLKLEYLDGELDQYIISLRNTGSTPISNIILQTDYPLFFGWKNLQISTILQPFEEIKLRISFRATSVFNMINPFYSGCIICAKILFKYNTPLLGFPALTETRFTRLQQIFSIIPSFEPKINCSKSLTNLNEYFLSYQIPKFPIKVDKFIIRELQIIDPLWEITEKKRSTEFDLELNLIALLRKYTKEENSEEIEKIIKKKIIFEEISRVQEILRERKKSENDENIYECIGNHIEEFKDFEIQKYSSPNKENVNLILKWAMECDNQIIKGAHFGHVDFWDPKLKNTENLGFPLQIISGFLPDEVHHDFNKNPYF